MTNVLLIVLCRETVGVVSNTTVGTLGVCGRNQIKEFLTVSMPIVY